MPTCVNLETLFGARYRVRKEADGVTWFDTSEDDRPWLLELPCRFGVVYPHGGDVLAAMVTSRRIGRHVAALPCILSKRGDDELVASFHVDDAEQVLSLLRPYRAHTMTEARRQALAAARARSPLRLRQSGAVARGREAENGVIVDVADYHGVSRSPHEHATRSPAETTGSEEPAGGESNSEPAD
jgi:hypothetical protein